MRGAVFGSALSSLAIKMGKQTRAALRVGFAVSRVRMLGSVLKSESAPKQALESVSRVHKHRFRVAFSKCLAKPVLIHPGDRF